MRRKVMTRLSLLQLLLLSLSALGLGACAPGPSSTLPHLPRFAPRACPFTPDPSVTVGKTLTCGTLTVFENRQHPSAAHLVRLPVAVFAAPGPAATVGDPVVYLAGGPGVGIVQTLGPSVTPTLMTAVFGNRSVILFDQRGAGLSQPSLACPEYSAAFYAALAAGRSAQQEADARNRALQACEQRVRQAGSDPAQYTTRNNAADVQDLLLALHLPHVSLFGVSYGTRLALEVLHEFPERIRSMVLDSAFPPQDNGYETRLAHNARAFLHVVDACAADVACAAKHPDLQARFFADLDQLQAHPPTFEFASPSTGMVYTAPLTDEVFISVLVAALYSTPHIAEIPQLLDQVGQGNDEFIAPLAEAVVTDESIAQGMYDSVACAEDAPYATAAGTAAALATLPARWQALVAPAAQSQLEECQSWQVPAAPPAEKAAVTSAVPTLIFEGGFDPVTPRANGTLTAQTLSHSYEAFFPYETHGVLFPNTCAQHIAVQFLDRPLSPPDMSCIALQPPLTFA
ncbi:MAG TPA: alpha/beta hydrolase [Ktedonobacterales bacterium]|nr:alpha/beta hydrolase [Ktedonobacterales bacterium]